MTKHPLRATFEHFDEPMSADFRSTLRVRLLADLAKAGDSTVTTQQFDGTTIDVDETQEVTVLKKIDRHRPQSHARLLVAVAAATVIAVGVGALVINRLNADDQVPTNEPTVSVSPTTADTAAVTTVPSAAAVDDNKSLGGLWTTGPVPIAQITSAMLRNGLTQEVVDAWVAEVGAPAEYTFDLEFQGDDFRHFEQSPGVQRRADETGTFDYNEQKLELTIDDQGDTYTFTTIMSCCDVLQLRPVNTTADRTAEEDVKLAHLIASYTSAPFDRREYP